MTKCQNSLVRINEDAVSKDNPKMGLNVCDPSLILVVDEKEEFSEDPAMWEWVEANACFCRNRAMELNCSSGLLQEGGLPQLQQLCLVTEACMFDS